MEGLLDSITCLRICDHAEQLAAVQMLPQLLDASPEVSLPPCSFRVWGVGLCPSTRQHLPWIMLVSAWKTHS